MKLFSSMLLAGIASLASLTGRPQRRRTLIVDNEFQPFMPEPFHPVINRPHEHGVTAEMEARFEQHRLRAESAAIAKAAARRLRRAANKQTKNQSPK